MCVVARAYTCSGARVCVQRCVCAQRRVQTHERHSWAGVPLPPFASHNDRLYSAAALYTHLYTTRPPHSTHTCTPHGPDTHKDTSHNDHTLTHSTHACTHTLAHHPHPPVPSPGAGIPLPPFASRAWFESVLLPWRLASVAPSPPHQPPSQPPTPAPGPAQMGAPAGPAPPVAAGGEARAKPVEDFPLSGRLGSVPLD
jgi:hypothetical protein